MKRMNRMIAFTSCFALVMMSASTFAEDKASLGKLGKVNVALKIDYINFTDEFFAQSDDAGIYVGVEGYLGITENIYLGGEIGRAGNVTIFGDDIDFMPVEVNAKYVNDLGANLYLDLGGGLSFNRANIEIFSWWEEDIKLGAEWLFGGQVFMDLLYKIKWFSIGLNGKYKITGDYSDADTDFSNYCFGVTVGLNF